MTARRITCFLSIFFLLAACSQDPAPVTLHGSSEGAGSAGAHIVLEGDTLYSIAERYNISPQDLSIHNRVKPPFLLYPGARLKLPPPRTYVVRRYDTVYSVSRLTGVSQSQLVRQNRLQPPYQLKIGQVLKLPSLERRVAVSAAPRPRGQVTNAPRPSAKPESAQPVQVARLERKPEPKTPITKKTPKRSSSKFLTPVNGSVVSSYGPKEGGLHNDGIDIAAPRGTPVLAADNGVVVYAGNELKGSGNLILVRHSGGWMTAYAHLDGFSVDRGSVVKRGQVIGAVGSTGGVSSPQLHFEVRRGTEAINPSVYLESS